MTRLVWDRYDERSYEAGVDMVAIYPHNDDNPDLFRAPFALSGVRSIDVGFVDTQSEERWIDGFSYHRFDRPETYVGTFTTFDTPLNLIYLLGYKRVSFGLYAAHQQPRKFDMVFRTLIGSNQRPMDIYSGDYKLHFIWNCLASESRMEFETLSANPDLKETSVELLAAPIRGGHRLNDTAAVVLDSRKTPTLILRRILETIYGSDIEDPRMINLDDLFAAFLIDIPEDLDGKA